MKSITLFLATFILHSASEKCSVITDQFLPLKRRNKSATTMHAIAPALCCLLFLTMNDTISAQTWGTPINVETVTGTGGNTGQYTSLSIINGNPAIAFYDHSKQKLKFMRATDPSGTAWSAQMTLDAVGFYSGGTKISLTAINGNPAIAYEGNNTLKYIRASDANGTSWGSVIAIGSLNTGESVSLATINGNPAITYLDINFSTKGLKYVRAMDVNGTSWGTPPRNC